MRSLLTLVALFAVVGGTLAQPAGSGGVNRPGQRDKPYVILVSLDGFKPEYLDRFELPNIRGVARRGARAKGMLPVFPSLTFPNHYSLVTGLLPSNHGIVSNRFYDPALKDTYIYSDNESVVQSKWYRGEPIWVTAESQGMVAACYFWPGSEAAIKGVRPSIYRRYSSATPNEERVETVLEWLRRPAESRPHMITLYFSEMDSVSHSKPLGAPEIQKAAESLDRIIGMLVTGIDALPFGDRVYLILTSDHGMLETSAARSVQLTTLLDPAQVRDILEGFSGPVASLHVRGGAERARQLRDRINDRLEYGTAYLRSEMPERFHYRADPRAGDVVVVMDPPWSLSVPRPDPEKSRSLPSAPTGSRRERGEHDSWGAHGWDPELPSMRALFVAMGPTIRRGITVDVLHNVDLYPFMAEVLGLKPADVDGRPGRIRQMIGN